MSRGGFEGVSGVRMKKVVNRIYRVVSYLHCCCPKSDIGLHKHERLYLVYVWIPKNVCIDRTRGESE